MRLLQFIVICWFGTLLNALECARGMLIQRGVVVSRKDQDYMTDHSDIRSDGKCYSILNTSNCLSSLFSVEAVADVPSFPVQSTPCSEKNSTLICSCDDGDLCNIRLYDLLSSVISYKSWSGSSVCYDRLLNDVLPKWRPIQKDNATGFQPSFTFKWYHYVIGVVIAVNATGFAIRCGDRVNTFWKNRKRRKEEERQRKMTQAAKIKSNSRQYHYLWPPQDDCVPLKVKSSEKKMSSSDDRTLKEKLIEISQPQTKMK